MNTRISDEHGRPEPLVCCLGFDQFPAQVIVAYDPAYRGMPFVVIRQSADSHKSSVWACSTAAKNLGIRPGMPVQVIARRFPKVQIVDRNEEFEEVARTEIARVVYEYSPLTEIAPNGRAIIDLTGTPAQRELRHIDIAHRFGEQIRHRTELEEISIGMARTRLLAGIMERLAAPDGFRQCAPGREEAMLSSMETSLLPGLSGQCREKLRKYGLCRVGQVRAIGREALVSRFGAEGEKLYSMAHEFDITACSVREDPCDAETVLDRDINDMEVLLHTVWLTADKLCHRLRSADAAADRFTMIVRYTDNKTVQRTVALGNATNDFLTIANAGMRIFRDLYQRRVGIRSIRMMVRHLKADTGQIDLFETAWEHKQKAVSAGITAVRKKMMRFDAVVSGGNVRGGRE